MFKKITIVEPVLINDQGLEQIKKYCKKLIIYDTDCVNEDDMIKRIADSDCILVSYKTSITKKIIDSSLNLKHVSLCCSYYGKEYSKIDINALEEKNISYSFISEHGDNGVVEFIISQTINLLHGINGKKWKKESYDLTKVKIGILGLGNLGKKVSQAFKNFGADVYYYSKTRKLNDEKIIGIKYLDLNNLFEKVDIISINLNRDVCLIGDNNLEIYGDNKIIINSSIGKCYDINSLKKWLKNKNNFYICDKATINEDIVSILNYENVIYINNIVGNTKQCYDRATEKIINNIKRESN